MNKYFKLPFIESDFLKGISIFSSGNEKMERPKVFDIINLYASRLYSVIIKILNREYPAEDLGSESVHKILKPIINFDIDQENIHIVAKTKDRDIPILRIRGWGMLTGHGGFRLDPKVAAEAQRQVLDYSVSNLNWALNEYRRRGSLKNRMNEFRSITDSIKLNPDQYVLIMCDGHCFSHYVKKKFKLPFDQTFIGMMNQAAIETSKNIQGFICAYVQSDEISFLIHRREGSPFFDYRLQKMISLVASWVSVNFMAEVYKGISEIPASSNDMREMIKSVKPLIFDGRAFNLPTDNDAFAWFLWRQNDCVRNSKQQAAQTYLPHKKLMGKTTDEQLKLLEEETGIKWEDYNPGEKYGRLIYREKVEKINEETGEPYIRTIWPVHEVTGQFGDELRKLIKNENLERT